LHIDLYSKDTSDARVSPCILPQHMQPCSVCSLGQRQPFRPLRQIVLEAMIGSASWVSQGPAVKKIKQYCCRCLFLEKQQATSLISRQKRNAGPSTLEQACMEKVCTYEEARKYFQDSYRTVSLLFIFKNYKETQISSYKSRSTNYEEGEQILYVKLVHLHPRYVRDRPENDLAVIELRDRIVFKPHIVAACLPEKDFAESILMSGDFPAVITGWKEPIQVSWFQGPLTVNQLQFSTLPKCRETYPNLMTNRMGCTTARANADCNMGSGSALLTLYRDVLFLTGVVSQPDGADCTKGYIFQKVSRHLSWLQTLMDSR
ncbi:hypothetical protein XENOCAPTIV_024403, partial [Xenoophorus captivus]